MGDLERLHKRIERLKVKKAGPHYKGPRTWVSKEHAQFLILSWRIKREALENGSITKQEYIDGIKRLHRISRRMVEELEDSVVRWRQNRG